MESGHDVGSVQKQGQELIEIVNATQAIMIISIVVFIVQLILYFVLQGLSNNKNDDFASQMPVIFHLLTSFVAFILLIVYYVLLLLQMADIDGNRIQFFIDNQCSDLTLIYSLSQVLESYNTINTYSIVAVVVVAIITIMQIVFTLLSFGVFGSSNGSHSFDNETYGTFAQSNEEEDRLK